MGIVTRVLRIDDYSIGDRVAVRRDAATASKKANIFRATVVRIDSRGDHLILGNLIPPAGESINAQYCDFSTHSEVLTYALAPRWVTRMTEEDLLKEIQVSYSVWN